MSPFRHTRAAALCAALSTTLVVGMAVAAAAFSPPTVRGALLVADPPAVTTSVPTAPATAGRTPRP